jgi:LPPG:FO 2-phospho-L-lactate transferase
VTVVCGGVGAARFLRALSTVWPADQTIGVVNTGDDCVLHGLHISPDLDTITYTLAGAIDPERGWGLRDETWRAMQSLARYADVRPAGSAAAPTWFNLGDQDLATHFYRTARSAEGASLTDVTAEISAAWHLPQHLLPMADEPVSTMVTLAADDDFGGRAGHEISFQEYFVQRRHGVPITGVRFDGATSASLTASARTALADAQTVVIAPSNPIVSIGPIRALAGVDDLLAARRSSVVAISPIVGGAALKGPADRMLEELGHEASVVGVARLYAPIASTLVIDPVDAHLADAVRAEGIEPCVTPSIMADPEVGTALARAVLAASA